MAGKSRTCAGCGGTRGDIVCGLCRGCRRAVGVILRQRREAEEVPEQTPRALRFVLLGRRPDGMRVDGNFGED